MPRFAAEGRLHGRVLGVTPGRRCGGRQDRPVSQLALPEHTDSAGCQASKAKRQAERSRIREPRAGAEYVPVQPQVMRDHSA